MRDYSIELEKRVNFIKGILESSNANGIVYGNSGGKDSTLVGILCKKACDNTVGIIMPCSSKQNYTSDKEDALRVAKAFNIDVREIDLSEVKNPLTEGLSKITELNRNALSNMAPRLRMSVLYAVAASENRLVAGTGNRSEGYMGYFTKWGDGAYDFNPIADLTVTEIYEFLRYLNAPQSVIEKAPSAGLFDGQTDEKEMGITYKAIDDYLLYNEVESGVQEVIERYHRVSEHKRKLPVNYEEGNV